MSYALLRCVQLPAELQAGAFAVMNYIANTALCLSACIIKISSHSVPLCETTIRACRSAAEWDILHNVMIGMPPCLEKRGSFLPNLHRHADASTRTHKTCAELRLSMQSRPQQLMPHSCIIRNDHRVLLLCRFCIASSAQAYTTYYTIQNMSALSLIRSA